MIFAMENLEAILQKSSKDSVISTKSSFHFLCLLAKIRKIITFFSFNLQNIQIGSLKQICILKIIWLVQYRVNEMLFGQSKEPRYYQGLSIVRHWSDKFLGRINLIKNIKKSVKLWENRLRSFLSFLLWWWRGIL